MNAKSNPGFKEGDFVAIKNRLKAAGRIVEIAGDTAYFEDDDGVEFESYLSDLIDEKTYKELQQSLVSRKPDIWAFLADETKRDVRALYAQEGGDVTNGVKQFDTLAPAEKNAYFERHLHLNAYNLERTNKYSPVQANNDVQKMITERTLAINSKSQAPYQHFA